MKVARLRALTQAFTLSAHIIISVETKVARLRALTHHIPYQECMFLLRRNEGGPIEGIDTTQ